MTLYQIYNIIKIILSNAYFELEELVESCKLFPTSCQFIHNHCVYIGSSNGISTDGNLPIMSNKISFRHFKVLQMSLASAFKLSGNISKMESRI